MQHRLPALDWMRGLVMVLMATDHASEAINTARPVTDSVFFPPSGALDALEFLHRWISHLCAPTFLFLAGTSLALSIERRVQRGDSAIAIDRDLLVRGLIILSVDLLFINWFWGPGFLILQVMYGIGTAMIVMVPLRRLPTFALIAVGLATLGLAELLLNDNFYLPYNPLDAIRALLFGAAIIDTPIENVRLLAEIGMLDKILVAYPTAPWWAMMALGWGFGRFLLRRRNSEPSGWSPAKLMLICGSSALVLFVVVRGINGYGNMRLLRGDSSWIEWLHVSKYPPSITYTALELGLMALILAVLFRLQEGDTDLRTRNPILVFGQTAFFFYVAHIFLLEVGSREFGFYQNGNLRQSSVATLIVLTVLYPTCMLYRRYKAQHPRSLLRFF